MKLAQTRAIFGAAWMLFEQGELFIVALWHQGKPLIGYMSINVHNKYSVTHGVSKCPYYSELWTEEQQRSRRLNAQNISLISV